jgi:hypothetical protein
MKKITLFVLLPLVLCISNACKKDGCTSSDAENYNSEAKKDDGSCTYKGNLVMWFDANKTIEYSATGTSTLSFYLNSELVGTLALTDFLTNAPICGGAQAITVQRDLGSSSSANYSLQIKGSTNQVLDNYTVTIKAKKCTSFLLN